MSDLVNHPPHYTSHPSGVECITVTEHMGFCLGNAVKYLWRAGEKGDAITDLRKSRWYLDREIARLERAQLVGNYQVPLDSSPGENSLADADRALAAELAADPAILASLAEWERTSGPPARKNSPTGDGRVRCAEGRIYITLGGVEHGMPVAEALALMGAIQWAAGTTDWKRVARALLDSANAAQDGDGYQVAAEVRATWVHYVGDANDH